MVDIEITPRCNLRCGYCSYFNNPGEGYSELPASEWLRFFEELEACRVLNVCLSGGEPFIREDLGALLSGIVQHRMRFTVLSNGSLITDDMAEFIASTGRCDQVQISMDGSCAAIHDTFRGAGAFDGAVRGVRTLQRHGVPVSVRLTIHQRNVNDLEAAADFILNSLQIPAMGTNAASYLGSCAAREQDIALTLQDRQRAMRSLLDLRQKYPGRVKAQAGPLAEADSWLRMEDARRTGAQPFRTGGRLTGCGCVFTRMAVRADGAMIPCMLLPHLVMGRINHDSLEAAWRTAPALTAMRDRTAMRLDEHPFCAGCAYTDYCTGNCPAIAHTMTGSVNAPSPNACLRDFLAQGGVLP